MKLKSFDDRFRYLKLDSIVGSETFGFDRYLNQVFYKSKEWEEVRREIILRDNGCDLGVNGYEIHAKIIIHHMNPLTKDSIIERDPDILNPEYLITTCHRTHNALHYSDDSILVANKVVERKPNDTCPWLL